MAHVIHERPIPVINYMPCGNNIIFAVFVTILDPIIRKKFNFGT
jgi:hypothetical protein